ncbi:30S ribosomal protein S6 [Candidatus Wolfebacteria bacterium]|nr:30S ribosomal protein S6 [Candidatus Wolfebacteria bacterium]
MATEQSKKTIIAPEYYEVGYHVMPTLSEGDVAAEGLHVRKIVENAGGVVVKEQLPQRMSLAYTIERNRGGAREKFDTSHFGWMFFEGNSSMTENIVAELRSVDTLVRFLVIRTQKEEQATMKPRSVFRRSPHEPEKVPVQETPTAVTPVSTEEIDKEIEKLVSE